MTPLVQPQLDFPLGKIYDYAQWTPDSVVTFTNVPWGNTYKDIVRFPNGQAGLNAYIEAKGAANYVVPNLSYVKPNQPIILDAPFNRLNRYNYVRVRNEVQPIMGADIQKDYYYFVTSVSYDTPNTTIVTVEMDAIQTFGYDVTIGSAFIERGHISIANERSGEDFGRAFMTVPEGMDIGGEYQVIATKKETVMTPDPDGADYGYDVLIAATSALPISGGTVQAPVLKGSRGSTFQSMPAGTEFYIVRGAKKLQELMLAISDTPWLGESIVSIKVIPRIDRYAPFAYTPIVGSGQTDGNYIPAPEGSLPDRTYNMFPNWRESEEVLSHIPLRYQNLKDKLLTFPYCAVEITTWSGTPIIAKPESWADNDATMVERVSIMPPNERIIFIPFKYNAKYGDGKTPGQDDGGDYQDFATFIANLPSVALANNGGLLVLGQSAGSLSFAAQSAEWAQQKALEGAKTAYDNVTSANQGLGNSTAIANQAQADAVVNQRWGAFGNRVVDAGFAATPGGALASAEGTLKTAVDTSTAYNDVMIGTQARKDQTYNTIDTNNEISNRNKALAEFGAAGDYGNAMAGIAARVQDARLTQASVSGQMGGEASNLIHNLLEVNLRIKMIDTASIRRLGEYWLRFGFQVMQMVKPGVIPTDWQVMSKFTYWKMQEVYIISAPMPEFFKNLITGMFVKGVTVWNNPDDIGQTDAADNVPKTGIQL